ncbi:M56 family metallopeptidase [Pedobacter nyackensis]|uniref:M56 family metallopeptidase n=1 Tax=Pedobacter nyackensis TaxID=475255 RepID=UPI00292F7625|nr:M56 family metallopeptidase [Pedobacter nyackensis]
MEWLLYLLKVSACMALFYTLYYLFLQRLTFFSLNRIYLLLALVISFLIPALQLEIERQVKVQQEVLMQEVLTPGVVSTADPLNTQISVAQNPLPVSGFGFSEYSWQETMYAAYWLIVAVMLMVFVYQMVQVLKHITNENRKVGRLKVVYKPNGFTNCSFLNYVFVDQQDLTEEEIAVILQHEAVHASRFHSLDKLFVNICRVFLWFNPLIYLYEQALEQVHEYEADEEVSSIVGNVSYANLLLAIAVRKNNSSLVHSFVKNPIKARINMLFTNQSKKMKKLTYLAVLPLVSILLWSFSVAYVDKPSTKAYSEELISKNPASKLEDSVRYRQKIKWTPEMEKARLEDDAWLKTEDFKNKVKLGRSLIGKKIEVLVKGEEEEPFGTRMISKLLVEYQNKDYYLTCDLPTGAAKIKGLVEVGDKLDVLVYGGSYSKKSIVGLEAEKIIKDGRLIYEMERPKIDPSKKPAPFLFEMNKVRFNDGVITKAGSVVAGKRTIEVSANGCKFILHINSNQVELSELASFKDGDKVRLRFVHEVKTGASTYTIADWVSISKDLKSYGPKNKQMFYRFYEEWPTDKKAVRTNSNFPQEPFIKSSTKEYNGTVYYNYEAKAPKGQKMTMSTASDKLKPKFIVDGKVYSFEEAQKFDQVFLNKLSANQGGGPATLYDQEGLYKGDWVFWFGTEPKLSTSEQMNRDTYKKYQGKTLKARVASYSYSTPQKKLMDGFYIKTDDGVDMKVFIEVKYAKQINEKLKAGDLLTIVAKHVGYWQNENSIVIQSSKLIKGGVVLFDRNRPVIDERTGFVSKAGIAERKTHINKNGN